MNDREYFERRLKAERLRREAAEDDRRSSEVGEDNPMYSEYLSRRADHKRYLANDEDGGYGQ